MRKDVKVPEISENVASGKVVEILVDVGDHIEADAVLLELETEKAVVEIPSPFAGQVSEILVAAGDEVKVGQVIARIEISGDEDADSDRTPELSPKIEVSAAEAPQTEAPSPEDDGDDAARPDSIAAEDDQPRKAPEAPVPAKADQGTEEAVAGSAPADDRPMQPAPAAPSVRRLARELGVDIHAVVGSGHDGRISTADVHAHVRQGRGAGPGAQPPGAATTGRPHPPLPDFSRWGPVRTVEVDTVRRLTAENMSASWRIIPHVTQFDEADVTDLKPFIDRHARQAEKLGGKLTLTAVVMKVCAAALMRFPRFNASIDLQNGQLIYKDYVHVGLAVDTPRGLLVPVIRDVQDKGIIELAVEIVDMAQRARGKKIKPDEFEGGTFTISNQGGIGGVNFTPIVVWPQAAILGLSRTRRLPRERDGQLVARTVLPLSLSYDHRLADGADAARFLDWIARSLEQGLTMLL